MCMLQEKGRMNILMISYSLKYGGGREKAFSLLVREFAERYHDKITVILLGDCEEDEYQLPEIIEIIALHRAIKSHGLIDAVRNNQQTSCIINRIIKQVKPELVFSFLINIAFFIKLRFPRLPVVSSYRENPKVLLNSKSRQVFFIEKGSRILDGFIFQTNGAAFCFPKSVQMKSTVIPNGVEVPSAFVDPVNLKQSKKIYACGRLDAGKHFDVLINAFSLVHEKYPEYQLIIFGEGEERNHLEAIVKKLRLEYSVSLPGVSHALDTDMLDGYLYVFTSRSEGYPNALAEAMMLGLPCIAEDCDYGPAEMIEDGVNGYLVEVGSIKKLSERMQELIETPQIAEHFSKNLESFRDKHSFDNYIDRCHRYVEKVWAKLN